MRDGNNNFPVLVARVISKQSANGQARLRVISKAERPGEEFTAAIPTLEDYYLNLVTQRA